MAFYMYTQMKRRLRIFILKKNFHFICLNLNFKDTSVASIYLVASIEVGTKFKVKVGKNLVTLFTFSFAHFVN